MSFDKIKLAPVVIITAFSVMSCRSSSTSNLASNEPVAATEDQKENPTLEQDIGVIKADAEATVKTMFDKLGDPASRHFHSKGLCAKGKFIIDPDKDQIPEGKRIGPFASKAAFPMFVRFSNGIPHRLIDDRIPSVFGFGVKVIGLSNEKFVMPGSTKPVNSNQDWNMATGRTFPIPTAEIYREQREASIDPSKFPAFAAKYPKVVQDLNDARGNLDTFLTTSYHSQVALHFGKNQIAKFSVAPCDGNEKKLKPEDVASRSKDYLREDLRAYLSNDAACFKFRAQIRPADDKLPRDKADWATKYPAANPTIEWSVDEIPFTTLATIEIPAQPTLDALQPTCEAFSINPGNALQVFRPIESDTLMSSRFRGAYEGSVTKRTELNGLTQTEPVGPVASAESTSAALEEWIHGAP